MMSSTTAPRIYAACLAAYNSGRLHGRWIDAAQDADAIHEEIREMLAASPEPGAEEFAIHDYEGFAGIGLGEYESIETVARLAELLEEHGPALGAFYGYQPGYWSENMDEIGDAFAESFNGEHDSEEAFAEELAEDLGLIAEDAAWPAYCIDWERAARDLFCGDYWSARISTGGVFVFRAT